MAVKLKVRLHRLASDAAAVPQCYRPAVLAVECGQPSLFTVERHVHGKWVCRCCEKIVQVPVHVIDKGIPTAGLQAHHLWPSS